MDLSCIILSGDLELYVMGMLPEDEANKIEQLALLFPEVQAEIDRISESLEGLALLTAAVPSPSVKDHLLGRFRELKAEEDREQDANRVVPLVTNDNDRNTSAAPVISLPERNNRKVWLAASVIGLLVSISAVIYLASVNRRNQVELVSLQRQVDTLHKSIHSQQQNLAAYSQTLQLMQSDEFTKINLRNLPDKPPALVQVLWNPKTREVYLSDVSLPPPPANKQYQLWAIVDGKPVDAGMLSDVKGQAQKMKSFDKADAFAITLENKGGSATPTMEAMYVIGNV